MTGVKRRKSEVSADSSIKKNSIQKELIDKLFREYFHECDNDRISKNLKAFISQIFESSEQCAAICSIPELEILYITPAMAELLRIKTKNQVKASLDKYLQLKSKSNFIKHLKELKPDGSILKIDANILDSNKETKKVGFCIQNTILDDKTIAFIFCSIRNEYIAEIENLRRSEEHYRTLVENIYGVFFSIDANGVIKYVSPSVEKLTGFKPKELLGKAFPQIIYPEDLPRLIENFKYTMGGHLGTYDYRILKKKGGHFWARSYSHVIGSLENPGGLNGILIDISEQKQIEEALAESAELFQSLFEQAPYPLSLQDEQSRYIKVNRAFIEKLGMDADQIIGRNPAELGIISKEVLGLLRKNLFSNGYTNQDRLTVKLGTGASAVVLVSSKLLDLPHRKQFITLIRDITDEVEHEAALQESEARYRILFSDSPDAYLIISDGVILDCNRSSETLLRGSRDQIVGKTPADLSPEFQPDGSNSIDTTHELLDKALRTEGLVFEWVHRRTDGSEIPVEVSLSPMTLEGRKLLFASLRDITKRKQAEEEREKLREQLNQSQKMESVGRLAGGVAHDFNNMLAVILGHTELMLERVDQTQPFISDLLEIRKAAERSAGLTRQLLAFARKQTVTPRVLDLNETVEGMLKMLRQFIGEDIDLVWLPGENLGYIMMDPSQIDQILANLCVNARDAIGDIGKITIETDMVIFDKDYCSQHTEYLPGEYIMMAVSDNGCGMDTETLLLVFEPFFTTKEMGKGTGLGLSTVYGIVKQNNGYINVYSEPGLGTTFKMYFPRYRGEVEPPREKPKSGIITGTETVLIVEDYEEILNLAEEILEHHGYTVLKAKNPEDAIMTAAQYKGDINLLITDVVLPSMNGKDLEGKIKTARPSIKTLFMSGYTADVIAQRGVIEQGLSFLQKPFTVKTLTMKVRDVLDA